MDSGGDEFPYNNLDGQERDSKTLSCSYQTSTSPILPPEPFPKRANKICSSSRVSFLAVAILAYVLFTSMFADTHDHKNNNNNNNNNHNNNKHNRYHSSVASNIEPMNLQAVQGVGSWLLGGGALYAKVWWEEK